MKRAGIRALYQLNNLKKELTITDIVFVIAPRINAAGRIDHAMRAAELLLTDNEEELRDLQEALTKQIPIVKK